MEYMKRRKVFTYIIGVLALVAIGLAVDIVHVLRRKESSVLVRPTALVASSTPTPEPIVILAARELFEMFPVKNASPEEIKKFSDTVAGFSEASDVLNIAGCAASPFVLRISQKASLELKNTDNVAHVLTHGQEFKVEIGAESNKVITVTFPVGVAGYRCDGRHSGILFVTD